MVGEKWPSIKGFMGREIMQVNFGRMYLMVLEFWKSKMGLNMRDSSRKIKFMDFVRNIYPMEMSMRGNL